MGAVVNMRPIGPFRGHVDPGESFEDCAIFVK